LEAGIEIYEYEPTMYHTKLMVVDSFFTSIGSANLDNRSFRLNSEANLNVIDPQFAEVQAKIFEEDLARSMRITLETWRQRSVLEQIWDKFASLFSQEL